MSLFDHQHDHNENYGLKQTDIPIPSNLFIFDTRWFEKVGIVRNNAWSSDNNDTDTDVNHGSEIQGEDSRRPDHLHDDKALVLAPPRNILKALEDKMALEQSGQPTSHDLSHAFTPRGKAAHHARMGRFAPQAK